MAMSRKTRNLVALLALVLVSGAAHAEESKFELGLRGNVLLGDGVPANDILGYGVMGRFRLSDGWFIGAGIDTYAYDFERPWKLLGLTQDPNVPTIDASAENTVFNGSFGRLYNETNHGFDWFWSLGLGFASPSVDDVSGPTDTGGTFYITTDTGNEFHVMATLGTSYSFSEHWSTTFAARLEHHFMDVLITDTVSGNTAEIDSQSPLGAYLGLNYRF
jgi:hypothetical protein